MNNNWIDNTSGVCPVEEGTLIDVKFRDGQIMLSIPALEPICDSGYESSSAFWQNDLSAYDIIAWRYSVPQEQEAKPTYEGFCEWLRCGCGMGYNRTSLQAAYEGHLVAANKKLQEAKKLLENAGYSVVKN